MEVGGLCSFIRFVEVDVTVIFLTRFWFEEVTKSYGIYLFLKKSWLSDDDHCAESLHVAKLRDFNFSLTRERMK